MLNYDDNLKTFIKILELYGIISNYKFYPNGIDLSYNLNKIHITFNEEGKGIYKINEYHTKLIKWDEQDIINVLDNLEKNI